MRASAADSRIHWFRIFVDLKAQGYSMYAVAHFTAIPKSTLIGFKNGSEPRFSDGQKLLRFWAQATGHDVAMAPQIDPFDFRA